MECYRSTLNPKIERDCPQCGVLFSYHKSWPRTYCSNKCKGQATIGNIKHWSPSRYKATCEYCHRSFETTPGVTRGRFCSRRCYGLWLEINAPRGEDHHNWRGGFEPYYGSSWAAARRAARARDDNTCQDCGTSSNTLDREMDVHHKIPFRVFGRERHEEANALKNLVTLCNACHTTREWKTARA